MSPLCARLFLVFNCTHRPLESVFSPSLIVQVKSAQYPIPRAYRLVEAVSRDLSVHLLSLLSSRRLMVLSYGKFCASTEGCTALFAEWNKGVSAFVELGRDVCKKQRSKDAGAPLPCVVSRTLYAPTRFVDFIQCDGIIMPCRAQYTYTVHTNAHTHTEAHTAVFPTRVSSTGDELVSHKIEAAHAQLEQRIADVRTFRAQHEKLRKVRSIPGAKLPLRTVCIGMTVSFVCFCNYTPAIMLVVLCLTCPTLSVLSCNVAVLLPSALLQVLEEVFGFGDAGLLVVSAGADVDDDEEEGIAHFTHLWL